jgi:hypothetical protein
MYRYVQAQEWQKGEFEWRKSARPGDQVLRRQGTSGELKDDRESQGPHHAEMQMEGKRRNTHLNGSNLVNVGLDSQSKLHHKLATLSSSSVETPNSVVCLLSSFDGAVYIFG